MLYGNYANSILHNSGGDLSRPAKFVAMITVPVIMKSTIPEDNIDILCKTFTIPTIKMEPIEVKFKGHSIPVRGRVNFEQNISVTFLLDEDHKIRQLFKNWIEGLDKRYIGRISGISDRVRNATNKDTLGVISISALNWDEDIVMEYKFYDVYPTSVSGSAFSSDTVSSVVEITVEFAYTTYESTSTGTYNWNNKLGDTIASAGSAALEFLESDETVKQRSDSIGSDANNSLKDFFTNFGFNKG